MVDEGTATLREVLSWSGALTPARAVAVVVGVASAVDAAHAGPVLADLINPTNIVLTGDDVRLVDTGGDAALSNVGAYLAPERLTHNAPVSAHTDSYALACVLFECLTGSPPFPASDDPYALTHAHANAPIPRPSQLQPSVPVAFDDVITRGLAKNPADRYHSAGELAEAARYALTAPAVHPPVTWNQQAAPILPSIAPPSRQRQPSRRLPVVAAVAAAAAVVAVVLLAGVVVVKHLRPGRTDHTQPNRPYRAIELPFGDFDYAAAVAVDSAGTVYVTVGDRCSPTCSGRVLKLPAGISTPTEVPFSGLQQPQGVAVDATGDVYVADWLGGVQKLTPGTGSQAALPFVADTPTGVRSASRVAVDPSGTVYVTDVDNYYATGGASGRVLRMAKGSDSLIPLLFPALFGSEVGLAVDLAGNVYATDNRDGRSRVLMLAAGTAMPTELPAATAENDLLLAADPTGNVYVFEDGADRVWEFVAGSDTPVTFTINGLSAFRPQAVDAAGSVYATDQGKVFKLVPE